MFVGFISQERRPVICIKKIDFSGANYSNKEREALAIVFVVTALKELLLGRQFTLQTDQKSIKYLFEPDKQIPNTASD